MAQVDVSIHRLEDFTAEAKTSEDVFWVALKPTHSSATAGLTLFTRSADQNEALVSAFEKCGAQRIPAATEAAPLSEDCTGNTAEEYAHGTSERR